MNTRHVRLLLAVLALTVVAAVPVLAGTGTGKENAPGQKDKTPKTPITLNGTIGAAAGEDGKRDYTLTDGGKTYTLEAGPRWFFDADKHPLDPYVGKTVKVEGEIAEGTTEVDVISVDGKALREPGKPPWAGGWKVVGEKHPGWSQEKADRFKAKFGDCFPPGQCKDKPAKGADEEPEGE